MYYLSIKGNIMITRRRFVKAVIASAVSASLIKVPSVASASLAKANQIPGWTRQVTCDWSEQAFSFSELFNKGYLIRHFDYPNGTPFNVVHHNLYESPQAVKELNDGTHLFVLSGHLENIESINRIFLFNEHIQKSELAFACLTLPPDSDGIQSILIEKEFTNLFNSLPCSIVLIDSERIETSSPVLPLASPYGGNKERILQTIIYGIIEPIITVGMISVDFADLKVMLRDNKLIGAGLSFVKIPADLNIAQDEVISVICSQITQNAPQIKNMNFCWANVCGGKDFTMAYYQATAEILDVYAHEDAMNGVSLTVDSGLEGYVMNTCYIGLT